MTVTGVVELRISVAGFMDSRLPKKGAKAGLLKMVVMRQRVGNTARPHDLE